MFKIHIWNLGKYNEGELVGGWINLPISEKKINNFLKQVVGLDKNYEEYMISDYELDLQYSPFEYENIYKLNLLAKACEKIIDLEKINCYLDTQTNLGILEIINIVLQEDKIPYYSYGFKSDFMDKEEKYGYEIADLTGISEILDKNNISDYFNFKRYGEMSSNLDCVELFKNGYVDMNDEVNLSFYSEDEIKEIIDEKCVVNINNQTFNEMEVE